MTVLFIEFRLHTRVVHYNLSIPAVGDMNKPAVPANGLRWGDFGVEELVRVYRGSKEPFDANVEQLLKGLNLTLQFFGLWLQLCCN